jgi:membrane-associated protein
MQEIITFFFNILKNPTQLIQWAGYVGITTIIFVETGLLFGFFLPGDSLLVTAGLLAAQGSLNVWILLGLLIPAAIIGDTVGFFIGRGLGHLLYQKENSFFFRKSHILAAQAFYKHHGGKTIIFARFIPILRTFAPTVAGAAHMNYSKFIFFNITGGVIWIGGLVGAGYFLGQVFGTAINDYLSFLILGIIALSVSPVFLQWIKSKKEHSSCV